MKIKIQIKSIFGKVLFEYEKENNTIKETLEIFLKENIGELIREVDLSDMDLREINFHNSSFYNSSFDNSRFDNSRFDNSRFHNSSFHNSSFDNSRFYNSRFYNSSFHNSSFHNSSFHNSSFDNSRFDNSSNKSILKYMYLWRIIPENGSFIAWKKGSNNHLIKLEIPEKAKRHNQLGGRKCRAEFVKVLDIRNSKGHKVKKCYGLYNSIFEYKIGDIVKSDSYNPDPLIECSNGIHFFVTKQEAKDWN